MAELLACLDVMGDIVAVGAFAGRDGFVLWGGIVARGGLPGCHAWCNGALEIRWEGKQTGHGGGMAHATAGPGTI